MAKYDLRILLETVEGAKTSYYTSGSSYGNFVDTDVELILSSSTAYNRITASVSCSYQNTLEFTGDVDTSKQFKDNLILSSSLTGSLNTGSISFEATDKEYDRLLRYKFIGDKVCTVLGLPSNQWIYVDQVRFPTDDEANFFQGNINVGNAFISDTLTFANNANINSDLPIYIDTGSDRYMKFIDTREQGKVSLLFGYDKETDTYEINASSESVFNIKNLNNLTVDTINAAVINQVTSSTLDTLVTSLTGETIITGSLVVSGSDSDEPIIKVLGDISQSHGGIITSSGIFVDGTSTFADDILVQGSVTATTFTTNQINTSDGSNIFGNSIDDVQRFTGSVNITGSVNLPDNAKINLGDGNDLQIYSDGTDSFISEQGGSGNLKLLTSQLLVKNPADNEVIIRATQNDAVELYYDNSKKLETSDDGIITTGDISASGNIQLKNNKGLLIGRASDGAQQNVIKVDTNDDVTIGSNNLDEMIFVTDEGEAVRIKGDGKVGIGTDSPQAELHVEGNISSSGFITTTNITASGFISASGDGDHFIGGKINLNSTTPGNQEIKFGGAARIQGNDTFIILDSDNQFVARADAKMNFNTPLFGLGGFDTNDNPSATLHISGAGNTTLFVEGDITSSGTGKFEKVGIGAPTPSLGLLHISGSGTNVNYASLLQTFGTVTYQKFGNSSTGVTATDGFDIGVNASDARLIQRENADIIFSTNNAERMRLKNDGTLLMSADKTISSSIIEATHISASVFSGSYVGDGTGLTNITAEWDGSINGDAEITGSLVVSGSSGHITASGNISSSATITGKKLFIDDDIFIGSSTDGTAPTAATRSIRFGAHTNDDIFIQGYHSTHNNGSHLRLAVRDDGSDSIRIETVGHSGDRVDSRGDIKIQGGSITNTISGDSTDSFNVQFENSSSSGRTFTNALFVSSSGRVGIGTTTPNVNLQVDGSDNTQIQIRSSNGTKVPILSLNNTDMNYHLRCDGGNGDKFIIRDNTNSENRLVIDTSGNVGIGTISPGKKLEVDGEIKASGLTVTSSIGVIFDRSGHEKVSLGVGNSDRFHIKNQDDNRNDLVILDDGKVGIGGIDAPTEQLHISGAGDTKLFVEGDISSSGLGLFNSVGINGVSQSLSTFTTYPGLYVKQFDDNGGPVGSQNILIGGTEDINPTNAKLKMYLDGDFDGVLTTYQFGSSLKLKAGVSGSSYKHNWSQILLQDTGTSTSAPDGFIQFWTSGSQRAVIDEDGKVGIGTTSPYSNLDVQFSRASTDILGTFGGVAKKGILIDNTNSSDGTYANLDFRVGNADARIALEYDNANDGGFHFITDNDNDPGTRLYIASAGNVGIGTTSPNNLVDIKGGMLNITSSEGDHSGNSDSSGQAPSGTWQKVLRLGDDDGNNGFTTLIDDSGTSQYSLYTNRYGVRYWWNRGSTDGIQRVAQLRGHDTDQHFDLYDGTTSTPAVRLVATGSKETYFNYGNVAIGTTSPQSKLHVDEGDIRIDSAVDGTQTLRWSEANNTRAEIQYSGVNNRLNINTDDGSDNPINRITIKGEQDLTEVEVTGNLSSSIMIANTHVTSPSFFSGFAGSGYRLEQGDKSLLTVDDLTVRGTMNVFELLIHQIRATNGSLFVSNTGKIISASLSTVDNHYSMSFDTGSGYGHSFLVGDLVRAQRFVPSTNGSGSTVFKSDLHIVSVNGTGSAVGVLTASADEQHPLSQSAPQPGYEYVRIGSTTTTDRQGSIYLTSDDDHAPFIDVIDQVTSHSHFNTSQRVKTRIGKLSGISSTTFPTIGTGINTYGFYASGSAFLEGSINADGGLIGGWTISETGIGKNNVNISSSGIITLGVATELNTGTGIFMSGSNDSAFRVGNPEGDNLKFDGTNVIITSSKFQLLTGDTSIATDNFELDAVGLEISSTHASMSLGEGKIILSGSTVPVIKIDGGEISASKFFVDSQGQMTASAGQIGGFIIDDHSLTTNGVEINKTGQALFISSSNFKVNHTGDITASNVDLTGKITATSGIFSGDVIATHINTTSGSIGGFTITPTAISSSHLILSSSTGTGEIISASKFNVKADGRVTASNIRADGGTIGGFEIDTNNLKSTDENIILNSNGKRLSIGSSTFGGRGFQVEYNGGDPKFHIGRSGHSGIKFAGSQLQITSSKVDISGSDVSIQSPKVFLGTGDSNFISASDGNIEISSSNFHLQANGDLTASNADISGKIVTSDITADGGTIANWDIESTRIIKDFDDQSGQQGSIIISTTSSVAGNVYDQDSTWMKGFSVRTRASNNTWAFQMGEMLLDGDGTQLSDKVNYTQDKWFGFQAVELGSNGVDSELFTIAADTTDNQANNFQARIAGFDFTTTQLAKNNITMSNANGGKITLNQGTIFLSGSGEGQFANGGITFDKDGNVNITGSVTIAADVEIKGDNGFNTIFFDDFSQYASITDLTGSGDSPRTNGSGQGYNQHTGNGEKSFVTNGDEIFGNRALQLGNDSGNDEVWLTSNRLIPFNSQSLYELEIRIKKSEDDDDGSEFFGITGFAADGTTKVNIHGSDSYSSQHYFALAGDNTTEVPNDNEYRIFKGYFKGYQGRIPEGAGGRHRDITDPGVVSSGSGDSGNKVMYFAPLVIANYDNKDGVVTIDYIRISEFNDGNGTKISGDNIQTGKITSNNLSTVAGSEFNLQDGTFKLGGTASPDLEFNGSTLIVSGTVSSSVGNIGGFTLDSTEIKSNNASGDTGLRLKAGGQITASAAKITGDIVANTITANTSGEIGGFTIGASTLTAGNLTIDSTNEQIKLGSGAGATANSGIFLDSDGTFNFATDTNNFIRKNSSELEIKSTNVDISGSDVSIQSPNVFLGQGTTNFISASGGKLEISSSNFHLFEGNITASNVDLSGKITATEGSFTGTVSANDGTIGGFTLGANKISSNNLVLSSSTNSNEFVISASNFNVKAGGQITASNIRVGGGSIGGFTIEGTQIKKLDDGGLVIDGGTTPNINVRTGSNASTIRVMMGEVSDGTFGFFGFDTGGVDKIFELSNQEQKIAGFEFDDKKIITSGSDGNTSGVEVNSELGIIGHGDATNREFETHTGMFRFGEDTISSGTGGQPITIKENEPLSQEGGSQYEIEGDEHGITP